MSGRSFEDIATVVVPPPLALVYEHGWQSWSPAGLYRADTTSPRPRRPEWLAMGFRPERPAPPTGFQAEGLLAIVLPGGAVRLWSSPDPRHDVASIRVRALVERLVVSANGPVVEAEPAIDLGTALAAYADRIASLIIPRPIRPLGPGWASWYAHWGDVTEADVWTDLAAIDRLALPISVVQVDDGFQAEIGDWLECSPRFGHLDELARSIVGSGREAGIWTAPFLVGARSRVAADHPGWLVGGASAAFTHWGQEVRILDVTHPAAAEHLGAVFQTLVDLGFTWHKLDFLYAGAMEGHRHGDASPLDAYREGMRVIREAVGPTATILGCGAPLLPSVGLVDVMRISPDVDPHIEPPEGDLSQPSIRAAVAAGRARAWMHGRWWVNDPDCLIVRPQVEARDAWAAHVEAAAGLVFSSDPLDRLDGRGLELIRAHLRASTVDPVAWDPFARAAELRAMA